METAMRNTTSTGPDHASDPWSEHGLVALVLALGMFCIGLSQSQDGAAEAGAAGADCAKEQAAGTEARGCRRD